MRIDGKTAKIYLSKGKNYLIVCLFLLVFGIMLLTGNLDARSFITPNMLTQIAYTMILVLSLNLVVGFLGELSLGHAGFMYIGAYVGGIVSHYMEARIPDLPRLILCMLIGGLVAGAFGLLVGLPALRLRGDYLAIVTLAFGEIVRGVLKNIKIPGFIETPANGFMLTRYKGSLFLVAFIVVLFTIFCIQNLVKSKHGRAITAIRDNEIAARAMGIDITYYKLIVFAIAAVFAGMAGVIFANYSTVVYTTFSYNYSIEILVMVVLGGMGSLTGSLVSTTLLVLINTKLQAFLSGNLAGAKYLVYALILIVMMILNASPKFVAIRQKMNWRYLFGRLKGRKAVPAVTTEEIASQADVQPPETTKTETAEKEDE